MRFLSRASWITVLLTCSLSEAVLYYPAGISVLNSAALVDAHTGEAVWKELHARGEGCTSLMGPNCFYTAQSAAPLTPDSSTERMQESSGLSLGDHAAQEHPEAMQCGVGIMAQYLQASQSQLGAVHGHAETLSDHWQRIGAARDGKLDDVVHVKIRPDLHEGEEQAKMGGEQSCLSSSSDKVAEAQSKSVCSLDDTEDEQHMAI
ncbi:g12462 [Coccomyxa viridis]|uniref:G12462 protein n=1 Tax=Coccomyxa viridis TaxID=1274662 RepID=A0ABP1GAF1_9CHLO